MPGKLGIAHQDHVSSNVTEVREVTGVTEVTEVTEISEVCPLQKVTLPLVNIVKLCQLRSANQSDTNIT